MGHLVKLAAIGYAGLLGTAAVIGGCIGTAQGVASAIRRRHGAKPLAIDVSEMPPVIDMAHFDEAFGGAPTTRSSTVTVEVAGMELVYDVAAARALLTAIGRGTGELRIESVGGTKALSPIQRAAFVERLEAALLYALGPSVSLPTSTAP